MAIAPNAVSHGATTGTSLTVAHTCAGTNLILFVIANSDGGAGNVTGVTYSGVAMTKIAEVQNSGAEYNSLWFLAGPATGTNNIVITGSVSSNLASSNSSYTGASQTGIPDSSATVSAGTRSTTTATTTVVGTGCWLVMMGRAGTNMSAGAATVAREQTYLAGPALFDSDGTVSTGSQSLQFTNSSATTSAIIVSFAPPSAAAATSRLALLGVG